MRRLTVLTPDFLLVAACGGERRKQDCRQSERFSSLVRPAEPVSDCVVDGDSVPSQ